MSTCEGALARSSDDIQQSSDGGALSACDNDRRVRPSFADGLLKVVCR